MSTTCKKCSGSGSISISGWKEEYCPGCGSSGKGPNGNGLCGGCHGLGKIKVADYGTKTCNACNGTGQIVQSAESGCAVVVLIMGSVCTFSVYYLADKLIA